MRIVILHSPITLSNFVCDTICKKNGYSHFSNSFLSTKILFPNRSLQYNNSLKTCHIIIVHINLYTFALAKGRVILYYTIL